jgi:hypothetical protein
MLTRRRTILYGITALATSSLLGRVAQANVWNGTELRRALATLAPGSRITMKPGAYGDAGGFAIDTPGIELCADGAGCVVHDPMVVLASNVTLSGQQFRTSPVKVSAPGAVVAGCDFSISVGNHDMLNIGPTAKGAEVTGCLFHDALPAAQGALSIGGSQATSNVDIGAFVHGNRFVDLALGSHETLYMKSSSNRIIDNVFINSNNITARNGEDSIIQGNKFTNSFGIVVQGAHHKVIGNQLVGSKGQHGIFIMTGTMAWDARTQGGHSQAYDVLVQDNVGRLVLGRVYGSKYTFPALNTRVVNHSGPIVHQRDQGTTITGDTGASTGTKRSRSSGTSVPTTTPAVTPGPATPTTLPTPALVPA